MWKNWPTIQTGPSLWTASVLNEFKRPTIQHKNLIFCFFVYIFVMQIYLHKFTTPLWSLWIRGGRSCHLSHDLGYWDKIPAENCSNKCLNRHLKLYFDLWLIHQEICTLKIMALCHVTERSSQKIGKNSEANFISYFVKDFWLIQTAVSF